MATTEEVVKRLQENRPPATDSFTYLTIVEKSLSVETLPAFREILEDAELTKEIGWDLVAMLIALPGSEKCLETVARLGNPREVILKVLQAMEALTPLGLASGSRDARDSEKDSNDADADSNANGEDEHQPLRQAGGGTTNKFITLIGMLSILYRRLSVRYPSRYIYDALRTISRVYPHHARSVPATTAVIGFLRSLSGLKRPPLPTRKSSVTVSAAFDAEGPTSTAPDPEADGDSSKPETRGPDPSDSKVVKSLLKAFVTCLVEAFVNANRVEWASRLLEFYQPERIVPGRRTMTRAFKDEEALHQRDALVGEMAAIAADLDLLNMDPVEFKDICESSIVTDPLATSPDPESPTPVKLATGGIWCLTAYWLFASQVFDADYAHPDMYMFPDHVNPLQRLLGESPQNQIVRSPGTAEALLVVGLWLENTGRLQREGSPTDYMNYHHLLTLVSVFHPSVTVRNAATTLAGAVLHRDPDEHDRLRILEDLLESCMFSSLQACAVNWLKEELIAARRAGDGRSRFATPDVLEELQYVLFPNLTSLSDTTTTTLLQFWAQNAPFHLQVANFAVFLFSASSGFADLVPAGMSAAVENRYAEPLVKAAKLLLGEIRQGGGLVAGVTGEQLQMQLEVVVDRLRVLVSETE